MILTLELTMMILVTQRMDLRMEKDANVIHAMKLE